MFKINHILTEQKGIMDNITKLFSEETFQEAEKRSQDWAQIYPVFEKVMKFILTSNYTALIKHLS